MTTHRLGIIMHGVTGRMGTNQHLIRSICAIRDQGGVALAGGDRVMPDPILVGRSAERIEALAKTWRIERWSTDLDAALADPRDAVFFDAGTTQMRPDLVRRAIAAGKHIYVREADRRRISSRRDGRCPPRARRKPACKPRRGAGQAVPARPAVKLKSC